MKSDGESTAHGWYFEAKSRDFRSGEIKQLPQVMRLFPGKTGPGAGPAEGSALWSLVQ